MHKSIMNIGLLVGFGLTVQLVSPVHAGPVPSRSSQPTEQPEGPVRRPGSVDLDMEYDLANLKIPMDEIHTLLPRDAIPSLTDPQLESASDADWLGEDARVIAVTINGESVACPLRILNFHEVINITVGGEPVAATYCPLCDSATLISRTVRRPGAEEDEVLEFGVSGALYNSNVLMYDRTDKGLWSQLGMRAVSGPLAGMELGHLPVKLVSFGQFVAEHPEGKVVSLETGHKLPYERSPYTSYFKSDRLLVPVQGVGDALPRKTLGLGVLAEGRAWFITAEAIGDGYELETPLGTVRAVATPAGISVVEAPKGVHTAQTFYYAWSAFNGHTAVIGADLEAQDDD